MRILKFFFSPCGRFGRISFCIAVICAVAVGIGPSFIEDDRPVMWALPSRSSQWFWFDILMFVTFVFRYWVFIAASIKRLHDLNFRGGIALIFLGEAYYELFYYELFNNDPVWVSSVHYEWLLNLPCGLVFDFITIGWAILLALVPGWNKGNKFNR